MMTPYTSLPEPNPSWVNQPILSWPYAMTSPVTYSYTPPNTAAYPALDSDISNTTKQTDDRFDILFPQTSPASVYSAPGFLEAGPVQPLYAFAATESFNLTPPSSRCGSEIDAIPTYDELTTCTLLEAPQGNFPKRSGLLQSTGTSQPALDFMSQLPSSDYLTEFGHVG